MALRELAVLWRMRSCMPPMACGGGGATGTGECTGSFSSVSSTGEGLGEEFRLPFLAINPPEIGEDDGDLRLVIAGTSDPLSAPPATTTKKKKRCLPGTPGAYMHAWRRLNPSFI